MRTVRLAEVDLQHALDEGEELKSVEEWREVHERFWAGIEHAENIDNAPALTNDELVVLERFHVVERAPA